VRQQVELYEATNGVEGGTLNGKPVIALTCKGAKSGKLRKMPVMRIEHNGTYAVVASNAGAPRHPFWYRNLVANPLVELLDAAVKQKMRAREVFGREKDEWWERADAAYSMFPTYRACAGVRSWCSSWNLSRALDQLAAGRSIDRSLRSLTLSIRAYILA
jgi:deazaflavin-dependent oxidoreductase (nitroreductase family)